MYQASTKIFNLKYIDSLTHGRTNREKKSEFTKRKALQRDLAAFARPQRVEEAGQLGQALREARRAGDGVLARGHTEQHVVRCEEVWLLRCADRLLGQRAVHVRVGLGFPNFSICQIWYEISRKFAEMSAKSNRIVKLY